MALTTRELGPIARCVGGRIPRRWEATCPRQACFLGANGKVRQGGARRFAQPVMRAPTQTVIITGTRMLPSTPWWARPSAVPRGRSSCSARRVANAFRVAGARRSIACARQPRRWPGPARDQSRLDYRRCSIALRSLRGNNSSLADAGGSAHRQDACPLLP